MFNLQLREFGFSALKSICAAKGTIVFKQTFLKSIILACMLGVPSVSSVMAAPVQWTGGNGHWYDFVILSTGMSATDAESTAESSTFMGEFGYLATIETPEEQAFLNANWTGAGSVSGQFMDYSYFLIGASDRESEGDFKWIGGPEDGDTLGFTNWAGGEPNNGGVGDGDPGEEDYTVAWWTDALGGAWNDTPVGGDGFKAYLVEYNQPVTPVPVPAALPLFAGGLGLLGVMGWRRKRKAAAATV